MSLIASPNVTLDVDALLERVGGDWQLIALLVNLFGGQRTALSDTLDGAFAAGNLDGIARAAHGMASSLGTLAATAAWQAAKDLERTARTAGLPEAQAARQRLDGALQALEGELVTLAAECESRGETGIGQ